MRASAALAPATAERAFRRALGRFATGVTLITAPGGASLVVNAFMSVSLDPPLVAFCVGRSSLTWRRMRRSARLRINVLDATSGAATDAVGAYVGSASCVAAHMLPAASFFRPNEPVRAERWFSRVERST
jgi:flavin reductase (DIM6/NTAB) family NADH-FMN oxidoreductase RutF